MNGHEELTVDREECVVGREEQVIVQRGIERVQVEVRQKQLAWR